MSETVAEILDAAADLIEPEGAWMQDWYAHDAYGGEVDADSPLAVCWCARGAIYAIEPQAKLPEFAPLLTLIDGEHISDVETWNDAPERTQAEVVAKLREAAAKAREAERQSLGKGRVGNG